MYGRDSITKGVFTCMEGIRISKGVYSYVEGIIGISKGL